MGRRRCLGFGGEALGDFDPSGRVATRLGDGAEKSELRPASRKLIARPQHHRPAKTTPRPFAFRGSNPLRMEKRAPLGSR